MDTSEIYVKMCDCGDVQKARDGTPEWYEKNGTLLDIGDFHVQESDGCVTIYTKHIRGRKRGAIWLPRQDQIQKMLQQVKPRDLSGLVDAFCFWKKRGKNDFELYFSGILESMEQLWLAFYMDEYSKVWNGKEWKEYNSWDGEKWA